MSDAPAPVQKRDREVAIKGRCPGALRPMRSGDGLLVRLKISGGVVDVRLAAEIARWSRRWGNGQIDLTSRANLHLRGLSEHHLPDLLDEMRELNLLDASEAGEAVRNVIASPLTGRDPTAALDITPIVRALELRLAADPALHGLPAKFGFAIDDGGDFGLDDVRVDVRLVARHGANGAEFVIGVDGAPHRWLGPCRPDDAVEAAVALSGAFLRLRQGRENEIRRMRDLVAARHIDAIGSEAGLAALCGQHFVTHPGRYRFSDSLVLGSSEIKPCDADTGTLPGGDRWTDECDENCLDNDEGRTAFRRGARYSRVVGPNPVARYREHPASSPARGHDTTAPTGRNNPTHAAAPCDREPAVLGVGLPFGGISAEDFAMLASLATAAGARELRLTPWRAILVPFPTTEAAQALAAGLPADTFILDPDDPRRRVAACPGAPACAHATTPVREHAAKLAKLIATAPGQGIALHVSGCEKGCAHPREAPVTLVARRGRYDLVHDGRASSAPAQRGLTLDQATGAIRRIMATHQSDIAS